MPLCDIRYNAGGWDVRTNVFASIDKDKQSMHQEASFKQRTGHWARALYTTAPLLAGTLRSYAVRVVLRIEY